MATEEVTGGTKQQLAQMREEHSSSRLKTQFDIPFEVAFCLTRIGKQPDDYDGPTRWCRRRASKREDYDGHPHDADAYAPSCPFHGGEQHKNSDISDAPPPGIAAIKHGMYARDETLMEDFTEEDRKLYDSIMEWAETYEHLPSSKDEDPATYRLLHKVALNEVRSVRSEEYLDDEGEVHMADVYDDQGVVVGEEPEQNALSREYRLLQNFLLDVMQELGLTPQSRQKMDLMEATEEKESAVGDIAQKALAEDDSDYDPTKFEDG